MTPTPSEMAFDPPTQILSFLSCDVVFWKFLKVCFLGYIFRVADV